METETEKKKKKKKKKNAKSVPDKKKNLKNTRVPTTSGGTCTGYCTHLVYTKVVY